MASRSGWPCDSWKGPFPKDHPWQGLRRARSHVASMANVAKPPGPLPPTNVLPGRDSHPVGGDSGAQVLTCRHLTASELRQPGAATPEEPTTAVEPAAGG